ncbi:hypothetical protein ABH935_006996 [Catenulispora sp. GAS73]|uniref:MinD/ParA family ATP-binding protein n=1 Tax=Catenulispora sp. GAS73 TaxID=3156269 RepID=UPI0035120695
MLITVGSIKSGAATTTALALAAFWPGDAQVLVVEADPKGGDLAAKFGLEREPSLVSLSAAARREHDAQVLLDHAQALPGGLRVVAGPPGAEQAGSAVGLLGRDAAPLWQTVAAADDLAVIVDVGRLDPGSPAHTLVRLADAALLVARPDLAEAHALAARLDGLVTSTEASGTRLHLVLHGDGYPTDQVEASLAYRASARLPHDAKAAAILSGTGGGELRRTSLARAAHDLGRVLLAEHAAATQSVSDASADLEDAA